MGTADHVVGRIGQDHVEEDRGFTGLAIPKNELALPAPDRQNIVHQRNARYYGVVHFGAEGNPRPFFS